MSEGWGADAIPTARAAGNLVEALSAAQHLPADAIDDAVAAPGRVADAVLAVVGRAADGEALDARERNLLFWGIHVLAEVRDTRLFKTLLHLLRRPDAAVLELLAGVVGTTVPRIAIATFDGDANALEAALLDPEADELARFGLFGTLAFLAATERVDREKAERILVRFDEWRPARAGDMAWIGWAAAVALGGFAALAGRVAAAREEARLLVDEEEEDGWFDAVLAEALARPGDLARFRDAELWPLEDAVAELDAALASDEDGEPEAPFVDPLRHVGRNDPCPCGSGRKYKKCCLGGAEPAA